jgi:beta-lactam-binding protein with PASTA domain
MARCGGAALEENVAMFASSPARLILAVSVPIIMLVLNGCGEGKPETVAVPDVTGKSLSDAATAIMDAGLYVDTPSEQHSSAVEAGWVIDQTPAAGTPVPPETIISLVVSMGPSKPAAQEPTATDGQTDTTAESNPDETVTDPE